MLDHKTTINENATQSHNYSVARNLARKGYKVFPCDPATKRPMPGIKWRNEATTDLKRVKALWQKWPDAMPGLPTGEANGVSVIDLDVRPDKDGVEAYRDLGLDSSDAGLIVRTAGGGLHLYFDHRAGIRNSADKAGIDVRGDGGYVIAPGAVGEAGQYRIVEGDLAVGQMIGFGDFPASFTPAERASSADQPTPGGEDIEDLKDALHFIPNDGTHDEWTRILMALHHGTNGSAHGRALAHGWSAGYPGFDPNEVDLKWRSFGKRRDDLVTAETLFAEARANGWRGISDDDLDDLPDSPDGDLATVSDPEIDALMGEAPPPTANKDGLTFLRPRDCMTNSRPYLVKGLIGKGDVGCVIGAPGVGKSVFAPDLAYAVAQGREFHGRRVKQGKVFYVAAEDAHGMQARLTALRDRYGNADDLELVMGVSDLLNVDKGKRWSPNMVALAKAVKADQPALVVIDTLAMAFPGLEENQSEGMGRVMAVARKLTQWGAAVLLVHHDTKDGANGLPRGHSLLNGAIDSSLHLTRSKTGIVTGKLTKNRNGSSDVELAFRIHGAEIGIDEDGDAITAAIADHVEPGSEEREDRLAPSASAALGHLMELLEAEGPLVSESVWRDACVDDRRVSGSELANTRWRAFDRAKATLARLNRIAFSEDGVGLPDGWEGVLDDLV